VRAFAISVEQCQLGAGSSERNWGDYKWIRNKKRNQLSLKTIEKLVSVHTQLVLMEKLEGGWRYEIAKWSESDGIVSEDRRIEESRNVMVKDFNNFIDDAEKRVIGTMNDRNEEILDKKYHHMCFEDDEEGGEIRRIVQIEWHTSTARGRRSEYQVVTQLIGGDGDGELEGYMINDELHGMIKGCPSLHNACVNIISK
jgi:hypothetical protein